MTLVTSDPATGLRRGPIRWPDGKPPTPFGCRRCGHPENRHGLGWHQWERPTKAQMLARMKARRERRLAVRGPLDPSTLATITANAGALYRQFLTAGPLCIPNHGVAVWCPGCAYDPSARPRRTPMDLATLRAEIAKLDHLPGDTLIVMSKDGEGNGFSPLADLDEAMYDAESTWAGDRYLSDADREATGEPNEYSEAPESAVPAVFLWPTN